ncbi:hypothetical protein [Streptomyces sp. Ru71]|uniref:effector-associated constant component EACC1 n=1 Tax=Streptomyces sp. Ru71 TaxID=2080746 RepID=UPI0015E28786|nr:hypothetical protein [Streptomyces sp. Ru71]
MSGTRARLLLRVLADSGADPEAAERQLRWLWEELAELDVDSLSSVTATEPVPGAKGDGQVVGALLVTLSQSPQLLTAVLDVAGQWLGRLRGAPCTVRIELDGDVLELSHASAEQQERLVEAFVARHAR